MGNVEKLKVMGQYDDLRERTEWSRSLGVVEDEAKDIEVLVERA